jgi:orotate phosphoribosyltransferase-like protein
MKRATREEWISRIAEWKSSGLSAKDFARDRDFSFRTMLWWQSNLRAGATGEAKIIPVAIRRDGTILVRIRGAELVVTDETPTRLLRKVVDALGAAS